MDNKIIFGAVFAALLMVSMPLVSSVQQVQTQQSIGFTATPIVSLDQLIAQLQSLHDYLVGLNINNPELTELLKELQDNIDALDDASETVCNILAAIGFGLLYIAGIINYYIPLIGPIIATFLYGIVLAIVTYMEIIGCISPPYPTYTYNCPCFSVSTSTTFEQDTQQYTNFGTISLAKIQQFINQYVNSKTPLYG